MFYRRSSLVGTAAMSGLVSTALAGPALVPKHNVATQTTIELVDPPMVTEVVPFFSEYLTSVEASGEITLGLGCGLLGLGCIAKTTSIESPTVCTVTVVNTKTTTVPCSTSTTYTECGWEPECGCTTTKTYWWTPSAPGHTRSSYPTCPQASDTVTITSTAVSTDVSTLTATATATLTVTASSTSTSTCPSATASALSCDKYGYLIQHAELIRVDLSTGGTTTVANSVGNGKGANAMAYNSLDNYLYARQGTKIVRIHADGTTDDILDLPSGTTNVFVGDIDETGFFWVSNGGSDWYKIDMRPLSSTFGQFLANGIVDSPVSIADWVYFPFGGSYLYSLGAINKGISLVRFSLETYTFSTIRALPQLAYHTYGAQYGMNNGTLYASDNTEGTIWAVPIDGSDPWVASQGPKSTANDGARCVWNLVV